MVNISGPVRCSDTAPLWFTVWNIQDKLFRLCKRKYKAGVLCKFFPLYNLFRFHKTTFRTPRLKTVQPSSIKLPMLVVGYFTAATGLLAQNWQWCKMTQFVTEKYIPPWILTPQNDTNNLIFTKPTNINIVCEFYPAQHWRLFLFTHCFNTKSATIDTLLQHRLENIICFINLLLFVYKECITKTTDLPHITNNPSQQEKHMVKWSIFAIPTEFLCRHFPYVINPCEYLGCFMQLTNTMIAQSLHFSLPCDPEWQ